MKRKSKTGKISGGDVGDGDAEGEGGVLSRQFRAVSEPEMISSSKKDIPTEVDFTSDDEDRVSGIVHSSGSISIWPRSRRGG